MIFAYVLMLFFGRVYCLEKSVEEIQTASYLCRKESALIQMSTLRKDLRGEQKEPFLRSMES